MENKPFITRIVIVLILTMLLSINFQPGIVLADEAEALQTAKSYLESMPFSRTALVELLLKKRFDTAAGVRG